jgi:cell wall-associated NlpC family hydrolase
MKPNRLLLSLVVLASAALGHAQSAKKVVLGKLGQTTSEAKIHASPNSRARVFYKAKPFEYLVVKQSEKAAWLQVLLQNGVYGYVPAATVAQLPYEVTSTQEATAKPTTTRSKIVAGRSGRGGRQLVASRGGAALASYSMNFVGNGTPYVWGGNDARSGVDCSGFVKQMMGEVAGLRLPRTAAEQALVGKPITRLEHLQAGDRLYFWENKRAKIGHTGIYLGGGYFVHSSRGRNGIATDFLSEKWRRILVAARR